MTVGIGRGRTVQLRLVIVAALGVALAYYLLGHIGFRAVLSAAASVGWRGFGLICLLAFAVFAILGPAWHVLVPGSARLPVALFIWCRMVRDGASETLPFSQVGGMMLGVRAASVLGVPSRLAVASMIVDVTTELLAQLAYVAVGLIILDTRAANTPLAHSLLRVFLIGLALAALAGGLFLMVQRHGFRWTAGKLAARVFPLSAAYTASLASTLAEIYRSRVRIALSLTLHFSAWVASAIGTWIALRLIGVTIDVTSVIGMDSLVYAARSVAFFVPNALGVQEAAYAVLGPLVGVSREVALAISLLKRARDIAIGIPILLIWQAVEGRRALAAPIGRCEAGDRLDPEG